MAYKPRQQFPECRDADFSSALLNLDFSILFQLDFSYLGDLDFSTLFQLDFSYIVNLDFSLFFQLDFSHLVDLDFSTLFQPYFSVVVNLHFFTLFNPAGILTTSLFCTKDLLRERKYFWEEKTHWWRAASSNWPEKEKREIIDCNNRDISGYLEI